MKKDFFEIMKNYDPEITSFSVSSESIKEKAMEKINADNPKRKIRFTRKFPAVLAAASVCIMAGVGVLAYELSTLDRAVDYFENHTATEQILDENDKNALNNVFKPEIAIDESNGTTLELTGNIYDENIAYFFFTLTAPEGTVLNKESYGFEIFNMKHKESSAYGGAGATIEFNDTDLTDNVTYFTIPLHCNGYTIQDFYEFTLGNMYSWGEKAVVGDLILEGTWTIPITPDVYAESLQLIDEPFNLYTENRYYRIDDIKISPISICVYGSFEINDADISLIMKDGSVYDNVEIGDGGSVAFSGQYTTLYYLNKPVDLANVSCIRFNDINNTEISVDDKYSQKYGTATPASVPDTTGMTEIFGEKINIFATEDSVLLDSIKMDNEKLVITLTANTVQDKMTIVMNDGTKSEKIAFGNGSDPDGDGIYTETYWFDKPLEPKNVKHIEIENAGLRLHAADYMIQNN